MENYNVKIAVTNLGAYNEGRLIFEWLTLPTNKEEIENTIKRVLGSNYEEYFITDWETDLKINIGEYTNIFELNKILQEIENLNIDIDVLNAVCEVNGIELNSMDNIEQIQDKYENLNIIYLDENMYNENESLAYSYIESVYGDIDGLDDETLERYFDYKGFKRDLEFEGIYDDEEIEGIMEEIEYNLNSMVSTENLKTYFDYKSFGRDLSYDYTIVDNIAICNY